MTALEKYAENELEIFRLKEKNKEIKKDAERELKTYENRIATISGVKFHFTDKLRETIYPDAVQQIIEDLSARIKEQKENADAAGLVKRKYTTTLESEIMDKKKNKKLKK